MKSLKLYETKKLHYGKYLYKLELFNRLNTIFRSELQKDGKLGYARKQLDTATECYRKNKPIIQTKFRSEHEVPYEDYLDAKSVYSFLKNMTEYKVRVDPYRSLCIYTNDRSSLLKIANSMRTSARGLWEPNPLATEYLLSTPNIIVTDSPNDFKYKITLGRKQSSTTELADWLINNRDKSKVGPIALDEFSKNGYVDGLYFYIRDKKVLMLVQMMVGSSIRRIDKLVYKGNLDKY